MSKSKISDLIAAAVFAVVATHSMTSSAAFVAPIKYPASSSWFLRQDQCRFPFLCYDTLTNVSPSVKSRGRLAALTLDTKYEESFMEDIFVTNDESDSQIHELDTAKMQHELDSVVDLKRVIDDLERQQKKLQSKITELKATERQIEKEKIKFRADLKRAQGVQQLKSARTVELTESGSVNSSTSGLSVLKAAALSGKHGTIVDPAQTKTTDEHKLAFESTNEVIGDGRYVLGDKPKKNYKRKKPHLDSTSY